MNPRRKSTVFRTSFNGFHEFPTITRIRLHAYVCLAAGATSATRSARYATTTTATGATRQLHCSVSCLLRVVNPSPPCMRHSLREAGICKSDGHLASMYLHLAPFMARVGAYSFTADAATCRLCLVSNTPPKKKVLGDRMCTFESPRAPFIQC